MALYNRAGVKITYNQHFDRLAITVGDEFVSVSISIFKMWMKLCELDTEYEKFSMEQNGGKVEVLKMCGNISLKFISCKNFCSQLVIKRDTARHIFEQQHRILDNIRKKHDGKNPAGLQLKQSKCMPPNNMTAVGDVPSQKCFKMLGDVPPQKRLKIGTAAKIRRTSAHEQSSFEKLNSDGNRLATGQEPMADMCTNSSLPHFEPAAEL